jgi:hypothetical protein
MGKDWIPIRVKAEPNKRQYLRNRIMGFPDEAVGRFYFQQLQSVTASAVDVMRNFITYDRSVWTQTGIDRASRAGGYKGRVDTGTMVNAISWTGGKVGPHKYKFEFGWLTGEPGYSIFQEQGTKNGVKAMNSLAYAMEFARAEIRLLGQNPRAFRGTRASMWKESNT